MFEPRAADLDLADIETALVRGAVGDYADEAAVLLLINFGHWLRQLQVADLITIVPDIECDGLWAQIAWAGLESALVAGRIVGSNGEVRVLRAAASIAEGHPVDLGDLAAGLDRPALTLLLAAIAHAAGSHDHWETTYDVGGVPQSGRQLPPLIAWPLMG
ncbi:MAG: uncharacterized protein JWO67_3450 [Streptosporangiaceae bacterium]|nr:uncharacterized protein [Streptosporangiaceae bacterium]